MKLKLNNELTLTIRSLGAGGEGVGVYDDIVGFVPMALPGEQVRVRITTLKKSYFKAELLEVLKASPDRVEPVCPVFGRCGGCQLMHLSYGGQLREKTDQVINALRRIGGFSELNVNPCIGSPQPLHYRNKVQLPLLYDQQGVILGLYARGSHDIVPIERCYIHCEQGEQVFAATKKIFEALPPPAKGNVRHLLIRTAIHEGAVLVVVITTGVERSWLDAFASQLRDRCPEVAGVVENINRRDDNVILGNKYHLISGSDTVEEKLCGLRFRLSPHAFFQVNTPQVENLYAKVMEMADLSGKEVVFDAYCGVGTMALMAAGSSARVVGIEWVPQAVEDARYNAELNGINNAEFHAGAAEKLLPQMGGMDLLLLNPPRKGCDEELLKAALKQKPKRVIYISCNPASLARDLAILAPSYMIQEVQPFDMFPQTSHVETVVNLFLKS